jgi:asparagine synthase (glutamine-hydrolysing)
MCGISGVYAASITDQQQTVVQEIIKSQFLRGPDHQECLMIKRKKGEILLGHNRLSIIDLSEQANQPLWDASKRYCIVYNGEIYNYLELRTELQRAGLKFNTQSDTEVILNAFAHWGIAALQRFHGPFAFALFDAQEEKLWLCRDRFGVRPLYYIQKNNVLYFASTTSALAKTFNLKPNLAYLARGLQYLVYEDDSPTTAYNNLQSLPSGSYLLAQFTSGDQLTCLLASYYDLASNVQNLMEKLPLGNPDDLLQLLKSKFESAVKIRLRSDVPLAISLSGGLDSSSVAAAVSKQHPDTIGFSFSHPDEARSEGPSVADCARFINIKMEYVWPKPGEIIEALYQTLAIQDAPFPTLSIVAQYLLYKRVHACGMKVLLGGQGGDEAFMGYKKYLFFWIKQLIREKRYFKSAMSILQMMPTFFSELTSLNVYWQHRHRYFAKGQRPESALQFPEAPPMGLNHGWQKLWQRQLQDVTRFSLPTLLRYEDRNAMGNSVESRLPYLDHSLVELGLALPESIKLRSGYGKWIIRKMMKDTLPDSIRLARFKRGFDIPMKDLLKNGLGETIRSTLKANQDRLSDFLGTDPNIPALFSDQQFLHRQQTMAEAITLLWLNKALI